MSDVSRGVALVTGSTQGIGKAIALRLAESDYDIVVTYHTAEDEPRGQATVRDVQRRGRASWLFQVDVGRYDVVQRMVAAVFNAVARVDVLVNNAGDGGNYWGPFHEMPSELWDRLLAVNLSGAFYVTRETVACMRKRGEIVRRIVNIGSVQGLITNPWGKISSYQPAKAGLAMFTKCLAADLGRDGTTVNCVAPGAIMTEAMADSGRFRDAAADDRRFADRIPVRRRGTAVEVANIVAFLASDEAAYINGQTIYVDGGMVGYGRFPQE